MTATMIQANGAARLRIAMWLAVTNLRSRGTDQIIRLCVGAVSTLLMLVLCSLTPTSLNVADRIGNAVLTGVPQDARTSGVRFAHIDDYFDGSVVSVTRFTVVGRVHADFEGQRVPAPGQVVVSDAAADLLEHEPRFRARYPEVVVGRIPRSYVAGPRTVQIWQGVAASGLPSNAGWLALRSDRNPDLRTQVPESLGLARLLLVVGFVVPLIALGGVLAAVGLRARSERARALQLLGVRASTAAGAAVAEDLLLSAVSTVTGLALFVSLSRTVSERLPIGAGVWREDVATSAAPAVIAIVAVVLASMATTWVATRRALHDGPVPRTHRRSRLLRALPLVSIIGGALMIIAALAGPTFYAGTLLVLSIPLVGIGIVSLLPQVVQGAAKILTRASGSTLWAARAIQADPSSAARAASGVTLLLVVSGLMLMYFPLISDITAPDQQAAIEAVGEDVLVSSQEATTVNIGDWQAVQLSPAVEAATWVQTIHASGHGTVLVVDCRSFASFVHVSVDHCQEGLVGSGARHSHLLGTTVRSGPSRITVPRDVFTSDRVGALIENNFLGADVVVPRSRVSGPLARLEGDVTYLTRPRTGHVEQARTAVLRTLGLPAMSLAERYKISTYTTRQFQVILWIALGLVIAIASLSTMVTSFERVRSSRPERRLLAISGARRTFTARALTTQTMLPVILAVPAATLVSASISLAFAFIYAREGGAVEVPWVGIVSAALVCAVAPLLSVRLVVRTESDNTLLRSPE